MRADREVRPVPVRPVSRLGMIVRADGGGLGALTYEAWRHLRPDRTLVVCADQHVRGAQHPERYERVPDDLTTVGGFTLGTAYQVRSCPLFPGPEDAEWLVGDVDTVFTAETWYGREVPTAARRRGTRLVLQGMPEMYDGSPADVLVAPTDYRLDLFRRPVEVLPIPVARDTLPRRERRPVVEALYHTAGNAFHDRNGTDLVLAAAAQMRVRARLLIRRVERRVVPEPPPARFTPGRRVTVEWLSQDDGLYPEHYPVDADALVLPRRFAGSCLTMQEAASLGWPIIGLDVEPVRQWLPGRARIPATVKTRNVQVPPGTIEVATCDPKVLARRLEELVTSPGMAGELSDAMDRWADSLSWEKWLPAYEALLR